MTCWNCGHDNPAAAHYCGACGAVLTEAEGSTRRPGPVPQPAATVPVGRHAGFLLRLAAFGVDAVIVWLVGAVALPLALDRPYWYGVVSHFPEGLFYHSIPQLGLLSFVSVVYYTAFTAVRGQTPGKMVLGLRVVDENCRPPGRGTALLRETVGRLFSAAPFYLGFLWVAWDGGKQGWHDKIAGTFVVRVG